MIYHLGVGLRSETSTTYLNHQALAQNKNYEPEDIGTSVRALMSYLSVMALGRMEMETGTSLIIGLGYARGVIILDGTAVFGPGSDTTGITDVDDISYRTYGANGFVTVVEMEYSSKVIWGVEVGILYGNSEKYKYNTTGFKFYLAYPFRI